MNGDGKHKTESYVVRTKNELDKLLNDQEFAKAAHVQLVRWLWNSSMHRERWLPRLKQKVRTEWLHRFIFGFGPSRLCVYD